MKSLAIIVPNYNHAKYLPECLNSILNQSHKPDELLIIDDASTDNSLEVIQKFCCDVSFCKLIKNKTNIGVIDSVNNALKLVESEYVAFCSADDLILDDFFSSVLQFLTEHPDLDLCCSDLCHFYDDLPYRFNRISLGIGRKTRKIIPSDLCSLIKKTSFWIPSNSTIYKKSAVLKFNGFDPRLHHLCDWFLNYQIALRAPIGYIPKVFGAVRVLDNSFGAVNQRNRNKLKNTYAYVLYRLENEPDLHNIFLDTGLLGQLGIQMIEFLAFRPQNWKFFPRAFLQKIKYHASKLLNRLRYKFLRLLPCCGKLFEVIKN